MIRNRKYKPQPRIRVELLKDNGKVQKNNNVVDRVIQQVIVQVLSLIYEQQFLETSHGFRLKRIHEMAVVKALERRNAENDWIVDPDKQFIRNQRQKM